ncbi:MAG: hypothetical protein E7562_01620 [Ruminococcaceae bacterium]|nr:hypothetical protein [Oscillospiraceae bacterium]
MKKVLALVLSMALVLSVFVFPVATFTASAEGEKSTTALSFSDAITVLDEEINPRAIRTKVLSDGTVAAVYYRSGSGIYYATSNNGGVTFSEGVKIIGNATDSVLAASEEVTTQTTLAKEYVATYGQYGRGRLEAQNPNLVELKNGDVAAFYRYNTFETDPTNKPWSIYYASICYQILDKDTGVWGDVQVMYECTQEDVVADSGSPYGVWEPDPVYIGDELFCYFADTDLPGNVSYQHIMYCVYDEDTGKFGAPAIAQNGINHESRDGMSVVTKLSDGTYAMVFESTRTDKDDYTDIHNSTTFVIKMSFSEDGRTWTDPVIVAKPNPVNEPATASDEYAVCAAPYVVTLPDGRLAVSYQTTDRYIGTTPNRVSYRIGTQVAISSQAITYDTFANNSIDDDVTSYFAAEYNPGVHAENDFSKSASLMVNNNRLYVYYSVGENVWTEVDGVVTEKHNFGDVRMAYMQLPKEDEIDAANRNNYIVYHNNKKDVTVNDDGSFSFATGTTNMLYGKEEKVVVDKDIAIGDLYSESTYTRHAGTYTFNTTDDFIRTSGQGKAIITSTANMTSFDASVTIQGNNISGDINEGYVLGGVTLFTNPNTLTATTFNPEGVLLAIRRNTSKLNLVELVVRYCDAAGVAKWSKAYTLSSTFDTTDLDPKFTMNLSVDESGISVKVYNAETGKQMGTDYELPLTNGGLTFKKGALGFAVNGVHTFTNFTVTNAKEKVNVDNSVMETAGDLNASATFNFPSDIAVGNQIGMSFRVKSAADASPGLSGYVVKLLQTVSTEDNFQVQLTRYGTNADGTVNVNLGNMYTEKADILGEDNSEAGKSIKMDANLRDNILTITLTNVANPSLTSTHVFDLTKASGAYSDYYAEGGFGFFKNGNTTNITVSDISFEKCAKNVNDIADNSVYTVYAPDESAGVTYQDNAFVNNDAVTKKIMLNDVIASNLKADATFEVGFDGNIKGGIIFRAANVGNSIDAMEGYSVAIWKNAHTTGNYGRIVLFVYKWGRNKDGELMYLGEVARLVDTTSFNAVYPNAENDMLASAGAHIKVNAEVEGINVTAWFEVLDENNVVAATSGTLQTALDAKSFANEADATVYNSGAVGVSISTLGSVCDFNIIEADNMIDASNIGGYNIYSENSDTLVTDSINNKIYSITTGNKQAVLSGISLSEFKASATMKSTSAGKTYNIGFDFMINESTHSGYAYNTTHATMGYEGYRVVLVRNGNESANPAGTMIYLFKFTKDESGYTRTKIKTASNADFFADYTSYDEIEVDYSVELIGGTLTVKAVMCEYPNRTITLTYDGLEGSGATGWFISGGGSLTGLSVRAPYENGMLTAAECVNGSVYAAVNSGAAKVGDTVKIVPVANNGYVALSVYTTVNGVKTEVAEGENGFVFTKVYGATEISAIFALLGDLDGNDDLSAGDTIALRKHLLNVEEANERIADCNEDDTVNVKDLVNLKKKIAAK